MKIIAPVYTDHLILREYQATDFTGVHAYASAPETVNFMTWGPNTPEDTHKFIQLAISHQRADPRRDFQFIVALQTNNQIIGGCGIHIRRPENRGAEFGYAFHRDFWGQGYGTEAAAALLKFGFEKLNIHRIAATCDPRNVGSARIMEKNDMRKEAHFRQHLWQRGEWRDSYLYAILSSDTAIKP
jgi:[ribosomal protein S5]-alanine N-acetyltransferase